VHNLLKEKASSSSPQAPLPAIEVGHDDDVKVGKFSFKLRFGEIIFEENSKKSDAFVASVLEREMLVLRQASKLSSKKKKESDDVMIKMVSKWIALGLKKQSEDVSTTINDSKKMLEALHEIQKAENDLLIVENLARKEANRAERDSKKGGKIIQVSLVYSF